MEGRIVMGTGGRGRSKNGVGVAGIELIDTMGTVATVVIDMVEFVVSLEERVVGGLWKFVEMIFGGI